MVRHEDRMNGKIFAFALCSVFFALCASAMAQQAGKVPRVGILDRTAISNSSGLWGAFRQELRNLGWIEGKNIEYRFVGQKNESLPELAEDLVRSKVDVIVVTGIPLALAVKKVTTTIPIVITNVSDPVGAGLVASVARPGGNVTGLASLAPELSTKRLEVLKDTVPRLSRVGVLRLSGDNQGQEIQLKELKPAALVLKLKLEEIETQAEMKSLQSAFETANHKQVGAIMPTVTRGFFGERKRIVELASKYRLPAIYFQKEFVDEGGLMSYGADYDDLFRKAAHYVDKILKGTKPSDLPVQQATKFEFIINLKAAKQIGLTIPGRVLERANQVIK